MTSSTLAINGDRMMRQLQQLAEIGLTETKACCRLALTDDDKRFLEFLDMFENKFLRQGPYDGRDIFDSLNLCWDLLRVFPDKLLKKIDPKNLEKFYRRKDDNFQNKKEEYEEAKAK